MGWKRPYELIRKRLPIPGSAGRKKVRKSRVSRFEQLEARRVLAAAVWNNVGHPVNVDGDEAGVVSPIDALLVINEINAREFSDPVSGELPRQVSERRTDRFYDVSCDNFVSPIDALEVINYINGDNQGGGTNGTGVYPSASCSPMLLESGEFAEEFSHELTLPDDSSAVKVHFRAPEFDTSSLNQIRDAFEIELTDQDGNQVSFPYTPGRDASYNWSEMLEPRFADGVETTTGVGEEDSTATINLAGMDAGSRIKVTARLVNNDGDEGTSIIIRGFEVVDSQTPAPTGTAGAAGRVVATSAVQMEDLQDISGTIEASYGRTSLAGANNELLTDLVVTNRGSQAVTGQIIVAVDNVSDLDVAAMHPDGLLRDGRPYWNLTHEMDGNPLGPGESIRSREIAFKNESGDKFTYQLKAYGSLNVAPTDFDSTPLDSIEAGKTYAYKAEASDPDGQSLVYSKVSGPETLQVNADSGEVTWATSPSDIGRHRVILRATDPHGLYVEQEYTIEVLETQQNRPPVFVSDPVTDAIAASGFEITTVGVGNVPAGVSIVSGFRGPRLVTANEGDQTIGVYAGENNDRFDDVSTVSTGFPIRGNEIFDVGYAVDVGLPEIIQPSGAKQEIRGNVQVDVNNDGNLDFISLIEFRDAFLRSNPVTQLTVTLGSSDGSFSKAAVVWEGEDLSDSRTEYLSLDIADFNNDGNVDVVFTDRDSNGRLLSLLGNGDGTFGEANIQTFFDADGGPLAVSDVQVLDLDGDGIEDLVGRTSIYGFGSIASHQYFTLTGNGDGTFAEDLSIFDSSGGNIRIQLGESYDVGDIDGDGDIDLVVHAGTSAEIRIWHNDGAGNLSLANTFSASSGFSTTYLQIADLTGDGNKDILYAAAGNGDELQLLVGDGTGVDFELRDASPELSDSGNLSGAAEPTDIDGDGDLDLILGSNFFSNRIRTVIGLNDGDGFFETTTYQGLHFGGTDITRFGNFADYNNDGVMDFSYVATDFGGNSRAGLGIRLGTRPGEFGQTQAIQNSALITQPGILVGDFNGDGNLDLLNPAAAVNRLGNGDRTFSDPIPAFSVSRPSSWGAVGDFNNDGMDDFVATSSVGGNRGSPLFFTRLANGDGTFREGITGFNSGNFYGYSRYIVGDFNGDGFLDFSAKAEVARYIDVWLNDPDDPGSNFTNAFRLQLEDAAQGTNVGNWGESYRVADYTGDGILDIVTPNRNSTDGLIRLQVWAGDGTGSFEVHSDKAMFDEANTSLLGSSSVQPGDVVSGDIDNDGDLDLIASTTLGPRIFINDGTGNFDFLNHLESYGVDQRGVDTFLVDLDRDGNLDLLLSGSNSVGPLSVFTGNGDGTFNPPAQSALFGQLDFYHTQGFHDFDGDGEVELVHSTRGAGNFSDDSTSFYAARRDGIVDQTTFDIDGDGNEEVVVVNAQMERLQIFQGDNLGGLTRLPDLQTGRAPQAVATGDLDGDGAVELLVANRAAESITVFAGNLQDGFTSTEFEAGGAVIDIASADVNGDGFDDVFALDVERGAVLKFLSDGSANLREPIAVALGDTPSSFTLADANEDGTIDGVIALQESNRVMILPDLNADPGVPTYLQLDSTPGQVAVVELNDDGNPDIAVTLPEENAVAIFYGRGNSQFASPQLIQVGETPEYMTVADADEDGRLDLIVANTGDATASVIYNRFDPNEVYRYNADAIDPDADPLTYSIVNGPGGLIINSESGELLWAASPDQVGVHDVTVAADDGRGGIATQSFKIEVEPARENSSPLIATEPVNQIGAGETFEYQVQSLDSDDDAVRYRLISGPEGANVDPTTGELLWDGRNDGALYTSPAGLNFASGYVRLPSSESTRVSSMTMEGWFNTRELPRSNGASYYFEYYGDGRTQILLGNRFNTQLFLDVIDENRFTDRFLIPFDASTDQWQHFAVTADDEARTLKVFVDGIEVFSTALPGTFDQIESNYYQLAGGGFGYAGQVDNFRIWNLARTPEEIQEGLTRHFSDEPSLVVDYRFEVEGARLVRDYSGNGNDGYRIQNGVIPAVVEGGLADPGSYDFTIGVEDGRGGFDEQSFTLNVLPELRGSIKGHLFDDLNGDGDQDDGSEEGVAEEPNLAGWHLWIDANGNGYPDPHEAQATTNLDGNYEFAGLLPGDYPVKLSPVAAYETPSEFLASVEPEIKRELDPASVANYDFAIEQLALSHVRGQLRTEEGDAIAYWKTYADLDDDGERDENEPMAISDRNGNYALTGLEAGTYTIRPDLPAGWSDVAGRDGLVVTLAADEISADNDFTLAPTNTSVTGGVHFVTMPQTEIEARQTFTYASVAMGIAEEAIEYDLSLAPEGMVIDAGTGLVAWRPTIDHVGEHLVVLRATNESGSISLHDFYLDVTAPNTPPTIVIPSANEGTLENSSYLDGFVGVNYLHDVVAQDAESNTLAFTLAESPIGALIDPVSGRISWTPESSDVGAHEFTVEVTDEAGASTSVTWTVTVQNSTPDVTPLEIALPRTTAAVTTDYFSRIAARDAIGRPVTWSLTSGPTGLTVVSDGTIQWTPGADQLGSQPVELQATNADGQTEQVEFSIEVVGRLSNSAPVVDSEPTLSISLGQTYEYNIAVSDADGDVHAFTLLEAPIGMSLHASQGYLRWTPADDQLGEHEVTVQVSDPFGDTVEQTFVLKVSRFGGPPKISSTPPTEASVGSAYLYSVIAEDRENDPLTYTLLASPAGMSIVETTGEISWTPSDDQVGTQDVVIQVSDGIGGASTQAFAVAVSAGARNLPPEISTIAPRFGVVGTEYTYTLRGEDPETTTLTFVLGRGPNGMEVNANSGAVSWTPTADQAGKHVVTFIVTDEGGASAVESFELDVLAENRRPTIDSEAPSQSVAGASFRYDLIASDADLDALAFELTEAPAGAEVDSFGRITWATEMADVGFHDFVVSVADPRGGVAMQSFTLELVEDTVGPIVSLVETPNDGSRNVQPWQGPFVVYARAIDDVEVASLTLSANGQDIPLDAAGSATFEFDDWFFQTINATATAIDTSGNVTTKTIAFNYDVPEGWSTNPGPEVPTAIITSPADNGTAFGMVSITGTADHEDFGAYTLSYRRADETSFTEFLRSTTPVENGELGVWDTSLLLNDEYVIRLQVATTEGTANVVEHNVGLAGELKLGNFQLSFTDMVIPVAGIPIEITRIYDTLQADRQGDFGYGWRLEYRDTDLRVGLPQSGLEDIGIFSALRPGVKVFLNVPGEGRQSFTFNPDIRVLPGWGGNNLVLARPRFTPDPGVTSTLSTGTSSYLHVNELGELHAPGGIPYNPASPDFGGAYVLSTAEGNTYRVNGVSGKLDSFSDSQGNVLIFTDEGIFSAGTEYGVAIERDSVGRIAALIDPSGERISYRYAESVLTEVEDRLGNTTRFKYSTSTPYTLESVEDPLGRTGVRAEYNEDGRLVKTIDAAGGEFELAYDPENSLVISHDPLGHPTTREYNSLGLIVAETNALGATRRSEFDSNGYLTAEVDSIGARTIYVRDGKGNITSTIDPAGNRKQAIYDSYGRVTNDVDASGARVNYMLNEQGNPIQIIDGEGQVSRFSYTASGLIAEQVEHSGASTKFTHGLLGRLVQSKDLIGNTWNHTYDDSGRIIQNQSFLSDGRTATETFAYDEDGRLIERTDFEGGTWTWRYDAVGNLLATVDALGQTTEFIYDEMNRRVATINPDGTRVEQAYDALGRIVSLTDEADRVTRFEFDSVGQLVATIYPDDTPLDDSDNPVQRNLYDSEGRLTTSIDELGRETDFVYDQLGLLISEVDPAGNETKFEYDANGRQTKLTDALDRSTTIEYDSVGREVERVFPDGTAYSVAYDGFGNVSQVVDENGRETLHNYAANGQLTSVVDSLGSSVKYSYDSLGNLSSAEDALGRITTREYDLLGRQTARIYPGGQAFTQVFDALGHVIRQVDENGDTIEYEYNNRGFPVSKTVGDGTETQFRYSPTGNLVEVIEPRGTTEMGYDSRDNLLYREEPDGQRLNYSYDAAGNLLSHTSLAGTTFFLQDELDRIIRVTDPQGRETEYAYNAVGDLVLQTNWNGTSVESYFDERSRLVRRKVSAQTEVLEDLNYVLDATGRVIEAISLSGSTTYSYDATYRLTEELYQASSGAVRTISYTYDAVGNRLSNFDSESGITTYEYDENDRLKSKSSNGSTVDYSYDERGALIREESDSRVVTNIWDANGRLISTTVNDGEESTESHEYDWEGNRIASQTEDQRVQYIVDTQPLVSQTLVAYNEAGIAYERVYGVEIISETDGSQTDVIHTDRSGSVSLVTNAAGGVAASVLYDGFGNILASNGSLITDLAFNAQVRSPLTGYDYLRNRFYAPNQGRFLSTDPFDGFALSALTQHRYIYANADPLNANDPLGLASDYSLAGVLSAISIISTVGSIVFELAGYQKAANKLFWISMFTGIGGAVRGIAKEGAFQLVKAKATEASARIVAREGIVISSRISLSGYRPYQILLKGLKNGAYKTVDEAVAGFASSIATLPLRREIAEWAANRILTRIVHGRAGARLAANAKQSLIDIAQGIGALARTI